MPCEIPNTAYLLQVMDQDGERAMLKRYNGGNSCSRN